MHIVQDPIKMRFKIIKKLDIYYLDTQYFILCFGFYISSNYFTKYLWNKYTALS
jgi:hypothetical protein